MKILFVTAQLTGIGGIESALCNLLPNINNMYEIDLCVLGNYISPKTKLPCNVKIVKGSKLVEYLYLDYSKRKQDYNLFERAKIILWKTYRRKFGARKMLDIALKDFRIPGEYDVAISFSNDTYRFNSYMGGAEDAVLNCVNAKKKIAWVHNDANRQGITHENCFEKYNRFDKIVNVSYACKDIFDNVLPEFKEKSFVVYNMTNKEKISELAQEVNPYKNNSKFKIVTVARLDNEQKRIDKAIDCCDMLKKDGYNEFEWHIVGDGPDKEMLLKLAESRGVLDVLHFDGYQTNPYKYTKNADIMIVTSDYESFGIVLTEALSLGTPVICTNYPAATEVVDDNATGYLTGLAAEDIYEGLKKVIDKPEILAEFRKNIESTGISNETAVKQFVDLVG